MSNPTTNPPAPAIIATRDLTKRYGKVAALTNFSLDIAKGEVFGIIGPNGSGKTTAIRLMLGLLRATSGSAQIKGFDCWNQSKSVHEVVTFLPGEIRLFGSLSGYATLKFLSGLRGGLGLERAVAIADSIMKLDLKRKVRTYSTGMKQKLALAQAFADPVEVLMLDEPTAALDPSARGDVLRLIGDARALGQTVLFSGHVLPEVEQVADRVGIIRLGRLMHIENMHQRRTLRLVQVRFRGPPPERLPDELQLSLRETNGDAMLYEHRGEAGPLLLWLAQQPVDDLAIGTDDLQAIYRQYHAN